MQARLTSAKESATIAADSEMKENFDPQATSTMDKKKRIVLVA
jgi:hypothetical protein